MQSIIRKIQQREEWNKTMLNLIMAKSYSIRKAAAHKVIKSVKCSTNQSLRSLKFAIIYDFDQMRD